MTYGIFFNDSAINWATNINWDWATIWTTLIFVIGGYLIGSVLVTRLYISLFRGGNTTYTNKDGKTINLTRFGTSVTAKAFGLPLAILTFAWDFFKPIVYFWAFMWPLYYYLPDTFGHAIISLGLVAVIVGHLWPVFWKFKGGVGIATGVGILMLVNWLAGLIGFSTWLIVSLITSDSGIGGFFGAIVGASMLFIPVMMDNSLIFGPFRQDAQFIYMFLVVWLLMFTKFYSVRYFKKNILRLSEKPKTQN